MVRNSLLIIDFVRDHLKQGVALREAVLEATLLRVRPILLTALATVLGSAVMIRVLSIFVHRRDHQSRRW